VLYIPSSSEENHSPNLNEHTRQLESDEQGNKTEAWNTYSNGARAIRSNDLYKLQVYNYLLTKIIDSGQMKGLDVDFNKLSLVKTDGYSDDLSD
jgi:hypothetical protein